MALIVLYLGTRYDVCESNRLRDMTISSFFMTLDLRSATFIVRQGHFHFLLLDGCYVAVYWFQTQSWSKITLSVSSQFHSPTRITNQLPPRIWLTFNPKWRWPRNERSSGQEKVAGLFDPCSHKLLPFGTQSRKLLPFGPSPRKLDPFSPSVVISCLPCHAFFIVASPC